MHQKTSCPSFLPHINIVQGLIIDVKNLSKFLLFLVVMAAMITFLKVTCARGSAIKDIKLFSSCDFGLLSIRIEDLRDPPFSLINTADTFTHCWEVLAKLISSDICQEILCDVGM